MSSESPPQSLYLGCATQLFNTLILFVIVNFIIGFSFTAYDKRHKHDAPAEVHSDISLVWNGHPQRPRIVDETAYGDIPADNVTAALDDLNQLARKGYPFQPWMTFTVPQFHSRWVNIGLDETGNEIRSNGPPAPTAPPRPLIDVYFLGGSTAFGFDLADEWTIPAYLEQELQRRVGPAYRVRVRNYGRPGYYSSQELAMLQHFFNHGRQPAAVVTLDGINDCLILVERDDEPPLAVSIRDVVQKAQEPPPPKKDLEAFQWVPIVRLAYFMRPHLIKAADTPLVEKPVVFTPDRLFNVFHENLKLERAVCSAYGIPLYNFWQPISFYKYDYRRVSPFEKGLFDHLDTFRQAFARVDTDEKGIISLTDLPQAFGLEQKIYVDYCHYNPPFCRFMAARIADRLNLAELKSRARE